jgi:alpha-L-fucosidase
MKKYPKIALRITCLLLLWQICAVSSVLAATYDLQKAFVDLRFGMFIHFNMGTFHDAEWVLPGQDPKSFNPTALDCTQWAAAAKSAGMKFAVLTTKHHDGFCLWPTKFTSYNVMNSSYPHDIVKMYVDAFRAAGITPCIYFSIWDRNQGIAKGSVTAADLDFIKGQLTELLTNYGPIPLLVTDGWTWQMGHQEAVYQVIRETVKSLQPNCLIVDHTGMTEPYEEDLINFEHFTVPTGNIYASTQGNSIMPKWFWHPGYDSLNPMPLSSMVGRLNTCESRYCNFLANCPPGPTGQLGQNIVQRLAEVGAAWHPNTARAPLPAQPDVLEHAVTPISATATSGTAANAIDGTTDWVSGAAVQTLWQSSSGLPQSVTLDLGSVWTPIDMLTYMPRADHTGDVTTPFITTGNITGYNIYVSADGSVFTKVASGTWSGDKTIKRIHFTPSSARYVRFEATSANGANYAIINEFDVGSFTTVPTAGTVPQTVGNGTYKIVSRKSGLALEVAASGIANGANVDQATYTAGVNQRWTVTSIGNGQYSIIGVGSGKSLDVTAHSTADGANIEIYTYSGGNNQRWTFTPTSGGFYTITSVNSGKVVDVVSGSTASGANVDQWTSSGGTNQQWILQAP